MTDFNRMTIMAALSVIADSNSHSDLEALEVEWGIDNRCRTNSKAAHVADLGKIVFEENPEVLTLTGKIKLDRAVIEKALLGTPTNQLSDNWKKMLAGLRFDGFEVTEDIIDRDRQFGSSSSRFTLRRMMPKDLPGLDFREAENEVLHLLGVHSMTVPLGHLEQAISAFSRGEWAGANAQFRTFYESYLDEISIALRCEKSLSSKEKRDYLGKLKHPFLFEHLNEWSSNGQKPQYIQGLMSRLHTEGSHAGLSEEDDAAFRLQITLITARLLLRRFNKFERPA